MQTKPGAEVSASELNDLLDLLMKSPALPPLCIWGKHGIGKTEIVRDYAKGKGLEFQYLAPAQFEELGDLIGMPNIQDHKTSLAPPSWVPQKEKAGILLLDDLNRADDRILRGLMPLLQGFGMVSWQLPENWRIVCTANPDTGDYSITPLDPALQTRMMHVQLAFDVENWANWARGNTISEQNIRFVKSQSLDFFKGRTTARTISQFFMALEASEELNPAEIRLLACAFLETTSADSYLKYLDQETVNWIEPAEFLKLGVEDSRWHSFKSIFERPGRMRQLFIQDLLSEIKSTETLPNRSKANLIRLLTFKLDEPAFRLMLGRELALISRESVQGWLADPAFSKLVF